MKQILTRFLTKKLLKVPFKEGIHDQHGNLILKKPNSIRKFCLVWSIICSLGFCSEIFLNTCVGDEKIAFLTLMAGSSILFGFLWIILEFCKTLIGKNNITGYRITGKKHLEFNTINSVSYTRFFGGCAVLRNNRVKLLIPFDTCGFYEFYEILSSNLGNEKCKDIEFQIQKRKNTLECY